MTNDPMTNGRTEGLLGQEPAFGRGTRLGFWSLVIHWSLVIGHWSFFGITAHAQMPAMSQSGLSAATMKLFGNTVACSAKVSVRMLDKAEKETMSLPMNFALLDRKIRLELDMTQLKSKELTQEMIASFKQMRMEKMINVVRPDQKTTLVICPLLQACAEVPMAADEAAEWAKNYKVEKTPLGKEALDGHPCEKKRAVVFDDQGPKLEAIVWEAADLQDFPAQIQIKQPEATVVMRYRDVQLAKPDAKQFDSPPGFTKYESMEKLMQGAMMKVLSGK